MPHFRVNSENPLEFSDDDLSTFIIVVTERKTKFGFSTFIFSNRKERRVILSRYSVIGYSTLHPISQFDVLIETGINSLDESMQLIGKEALRIFLTVNNRPLSNSDLARILAAADAKSTEEEEDYLGYPSP